MTALKESGLTQFVSVLILVMREKEGQRSGLKMRLRGIWSCCGIYLIRNHCPFSLVFNQEKSKV